MEKECVSNLYWLGIKAYMLVLAQGDVDDTSDGHACFWRQGASVNAEHAVCGDRCFVHTQNAVARHVGVQIM